MFRRVKSSGIYKSVPHSLVALASFPFVQRRALYGHQKGTITSRSLELHFDRTQHAQKGGKVSGDACGILLNRNKQRPITAMQKDVESASRASWRSIVTKLSEYVELWHPKKDSDEFYQKRPSHADVHRMFQHELHQVILLLIESWQEAGIAEVIQLMSVLQGIAYVLPEPLSTPTWSVHRHQWRGDEIASPLSKSIGEKNQEDNSLEEEEEFHEKHPWGSGPLQRPNLQRDLSFLHYLLLRKVDNYLCLENKNLKEKQDENEGERSRGQSSKSRREQVMEERFKSVVKLYLEGLPNESKTFLEKGDFPELVKVVRIQQQLRTSGNSHQATLST